MAISKQEKAQLDALVDQWLELDINKDSRAEILSLQKAGNYDVLQSKLAHRIAFGTAGLRSSMEPGFAHMNDVTVLQASQGLVEYLLNGTAAGEENTAQGPPSLVVGYDHRYHSQRFAEITASVALARGLIVYYLGSVNALSEESNAGDFDARLDRSYVHTPMVPFAIDHYGASAGVMVTASHNPARDNGYKVYYGNGCQIIPPVDREIAASIDANLSPWHDKHVWDVQKNFAEGLSSGRLRAVKPEAQALYVDAVMSKLVAVSHVSYDFVYTPMHGVGAEVFSEVCGRMGVTFDIVSEQARPDPAFPTVKFPNPEEAGALDLAIAHAKSRKCRLVVANDPDADRFSVAVDSQKHGWKQLTGNEIGILFAAYVLEVLTPPQDLPNTYLVNSTVSSQLLRAMAAKLGCNYTDTLTGFKWIGNEAIALKRKGYRVPFGYEEAIGYMFGLVNDKDGISAAVMWMQLYEQWFASGTQDPFDKLDEIYGKFGWYKECNGYYKLDDLTKTGQIFNGTIRASYSPDEHYPRQLGDFTVVEWRDLTVGYDSSTSDHVPVLPTDANSQMITAVLEETQPSSTTGESSQNKAPTTGTESRVRFTCRGSGTEPKLKVYIEGSSIQSEHDAHRLATKCWTTLRDEWFRPEATGLEEVAGV